MRLLNPRPLLLTLALFIAALGVLGQSRPALAVSYSVDTTSDASLTACTGAAADCSLRGALANAGTSVAVTDTITFDAAVFPPGAPATITIGGGLSVSPGAAITVDGTGAGVIVDGAGEPSLFNCITVGGPHIVRNIQFTDCDIGINVTGANATIGPGNVIFDNGGITGAAIALASTGGVVKGNKIGTNPAGTIVNGLGANTTGVLVTNTGNLVGGSSDGDRNIISGNVTGVDIRTSSTTVRGNFIGTDLNGTVDLGNTGDGVYIVTGGSNIIGGPGSFGNVISGNNGRGIQLSTDSNVIKGNLIGVPASGITALPNTLAGILINSPAANNTIGGGGVGEGNTISGNGGSGVGISGTGNVVKGNQIGTIGGNGDLGNGSIGVFVSAATGTVIGGSGTGERNIISGNQGDGVRLGNGANNTVIKGNYIGLGFNGSTVIPNGGDGVFVGGTNGAIIGGPLAGEGNVIAGNVSDGVQLTINTAGSAIAGNIIGLDATGTLDKGNGGNGILVTDSDSDVIGGTTDGHRNVISGNDGPAGIRVEAASTVTSIRGNYIGTDITGAAAISNTDGITILNSLNITVGGGGQGTRNVISGNIDDGVEISGSSQSVTVSGNYIGVNAAGSGDLGNGANGIQQYGLATLSAIGGETSSERNVISGNNGTAGILMSSPNNTIAGNYIGLDAAGATSIGNNYGILVQGNNNQIGGDKDGHRNVISGNLDHGVAILGTGNSLLTNIIGLDAGGTLDRGNGSDGINVQGNGNFIGGTSTPGDGNVIAGNNSDGIEVTDAVTGVVIRANKIGTDVTGTLDRGNSLNGIFLNGADSNTIGGTTAADRNIISGNNSDGVELNTAANTNTIKNNYVGTDVTGTLDRGNSAIGVNIINSDSNILGAAGEGNLLSGNNQDGAEISSTAAGNTVQANIIGLKADSVSALGNGTNGIQMGGSVNNNTVGGDLNTLANHIAFNVGDGIVLSSGTGNLLARNSIHDNVLLGIDLVNDGIVTPNDLDDPDVGANNLQNFPILTSATSVTTFTNVVGSLNSTPSTSFNLRFFYSDSCDGSGNGEGGVHFAGTVVATNAGGDVSFNANLAGVAPSLKFVTVTATAPGNNTSEFSNCVQVPALTVDTTSDANLTACTTAAADCSLRGAINDANAASDADVVQFAIASGAQTIAPLSGLPTITAPVSIDGTTQPGFAGLPLIQIDGVGAGVIPGFNITIGPSAIKGLVVNRFNHQGIILQGNGTIISGNYIGTNAAGAADLGNAQFGIYIAAGSDNVIGGTTVAERNLISGNEQGGIVMNGTENHLIGNYIGTDVTGTLGLGNSLRGIFVGGADQFIGGGAAGEGNVISGNNGDGIRVGIAGSGTEIRGNLIGTNAAGTGSLANAGSGIGIDEADLVSIGAPAAAARNVISGNGIDGITITTSANNNRITGNHIGTNLAGTAALGNGRDGVNVSAASTGNTIGDGTVGGRNVISGNLADGVDIIGGGSTGNSILGNYIGTDATGALDLGNNDDGIEFEGANAETISGNVISGNGGNGIAMLEGANNAIESNRIGTVAASDSPLGNGGNGVYLIDSPGNTFGTALGGSPNRIAHNSLAGIRMDGTLSTANRIIGNSIHSNGGLGIDLTGTVGVTLNDVGDADAGGNNLQNFPVVHVASVGSIPGTTVVYLSLNSTPSTAFTTSAYVNDSCDPSGQGEGQVSLELNSVTTNAVGAAQLSFTFDAAAAPGSFITATATDPAGNTSEFSACRAVTTDFDGDGSLDGVDNCLAWPNPAQTLPTWAIPANDPDCDGFTTLIESYVATDPVDACNTTNTGNDEPVDAWPTDFNDSRLTSLADVVLMGPFYNQATGADPAKRRFDLNASGVVSLADVVLMGQFYNKGCS